MRMRLEGDGLTVWISRTETGNWADGWYGNGRWPCSQLAYKRLCATYDTNGLLDLTVNGNDPPLDLEADEFSACVAYFVGQALPEDHPCYFVVVGQFEGGQ